MLNKKFMNEFRLSYPNEKVVAVTKYTDYLGVQAFVDYGFKNIGENRVDSFLDKYENVTGAIWHFIGTLQTKKVKKVIDKIDYLHSLDRLSLANEIQRRATKKVKCFIEVKTSMEDTKHGIDISELDDFIKEISHLDKIEIVGFMTMAPETDNIGEITRCFKIMRDLKDKYGLPELSMGMSNDYKEAIEYGATYIRLGRILYEGGIK